MAVIIPMVITDAGRAEVIDAAAGGFAASLLTEVGFGVGKYTASSSQTTLQDEFKRIDTIAGGPISPAQIHLTIRDGHTPDGYSVFELGVYLESGTLFAVYSQQTAIFEKAADTDAFLTFDFELTGDVTPDMITFGDTNFVFNSATTTVEGLVQLATPAEVAAGTDATKAATSAGVKAAIDAIPAVDLSGYAKQGELPTALSPVEGAGIYRAGEVRVLEFGGVNDQAGNEPLRLTVQASADTSVKSSMYLYRQIGPGWTVVDSWTSNGQRPQATILQAQTGAGGEDGTVMSAHRVKDAIDAQAAKKGVVTLSAGPQTAGLYANNSTYGFSVEFPAVTGQSGRLYGASDDKLHTQIWDAGTSSWTTIATWSDDDGVADIARNVVDEERPFATATQVQDGLSTTTVVTPYGLSNRFATLARTGLVQLAGTPDATAGTDNAKAMTPIRTKEAIDHFRPVYLHSKGGTATNGWRLYSDGWMDQWGNNALPVATTDINVTFHRPFLSNPSHVSVSWLSNPSFRPFLTRTQVASSMTLKFGDPLVGAAASGIIEWRVTGYTAPPE